MTSSVATAILAVWLVFGVTPSGRALDLAAFAGRLDASPALHGLNAGLLNAITATSAAAGLLGLVVIGVWRNRLAAALRAGGAVAAATVTAELLKLTLPHAGARDQVWTWAGGGSFPSGHTTIAASMSLALLSVSSPTWRRRLVGLLLAWTVVTSTATITMGWHRPSDVLGGLGVAALWHRVLVSDRGRGGVRTTGSTGAGGTSLSTLAIPALWWVTATAIVLWGSSPAAAEGWAELLTTAYLVALATVAVGAVVLFVCSPVAAGERGRGPTVRRPPPLRLRS